MTIEKNPYAYWNLEEKNTQNNPQNIDTDVEKSAHKCFWGRLIVAADGINSTVRKVVYQDTSYPHGMPPFAAQGANQGLEDALTIATLISRIVISDKLNDINVIQEAFKKYEYLRRPLIDYVQEVTMKSLNYYSNEEELEKCNQKIFARNFEQLL